MYAVRLEMEEQADLSSEPPPEPTVTIDCEESIDVAWLETKVNEALMCMNKESSCISIAVVSDDKMATLHSEHAGIDETTDVLTFDHGSDQDKVDADIAVCIDVASRAADEREHSLESELLLYIVHGILHCAGFDDRSDEEHTQMHREEDRILQAIGVGTIWSNGS